MSKTTIHCKLGLTIGLLLFASQAIAVQQPKNWNNHGFPTPALEPMLGKVDVAPSVWQPVPEANIAPWQAFRYAGGGIALAVGEPFALTGNNPTDSQIAASALKYVHSNHKDLNTEGCEYTIEHIDRQNKSIIVVLNSTLEQTPVYGSYIVLTMDSDGHVNQIKARGYGGLAQGAFKLNSTEAFRCAVELFKRQDIYLEHSSKVWLPRKRDDGKLILHACWLVDLTADEAEFRPTVFIDAETGAALAVENRVQYEQLNGQIFGMYKPRYGRDSLQQNIFPFERVDYGQTRAYGDAEGRFFFEVQPNLAPFDLRTQLRGRWVDVNWEDGPDASISVRIGQVAPFTLVWTERNGRDDERSLYYHTNFIHSFWKALDPRFVGMDWAVPATCGYGNNYDNAFWNGQGMFFGEGGEMDNFALYCDIVYHEYGHGVTSYLYPRGNLPYEGESGALNEAWSDYFPCSITDEPLMGEGGLVTGGIVRNIDNNLVYPRDIVNEVHADSRIISAAMWHTRQVLGRRYCDSLFHFARYRQGTDFLRYFTDVLFTDDNDNNITNGTPHYETLYEQFGRHGIGPGLIAKFALNRFDLFDDRNQGASGNDNAVWEPGETVRIDFEVERLGTLYPPPARNVAATLTCDNPGVELLNAEIRLGEMRVGQRTVAPQPFLFHIRDDAALSFASFIVELSADGLPANARFRDTLRIPLGQPVLGLIKDGQADEDYTYWFNQSLDSLGLIYSTIDVYAPRVALNEMLTPFKTVIWFTGDAEAGILRSADRQALIQFILRGGNVLLTGQSAGQAANAATFFRDYFGAQHIVDSVGQRAVIGVAGDPVAQRFRLLLQGGRGAMNQDRPMGIEAVNGGVAIYHWTDASWQPTEIAAGVRFENRISNSHAVYFSFGVEAIGGHGPANNRTNTRAQVLGAALDWLGIPNRVQDQAAHPVAFTVGEPFPNPFNGSVSIPFNIPAPGLVSITILNINGQEVFNRQSYYGIGSQIIAVDAGELSAGYYFSRLKTAQGAVVKRLLIIK